MKRFFLLACAFAVGAMATSPAHALRWPWNKGTPWPDSSTQPVETLRHPTVETHFAARAAEGRTDTPYVFAAFGDQRALADGEWQECLQRIVEWERANTEVAFLLDTGDIVYDGRRSDQFHWLEDEVLAIAPHIPYLVGVGNHEVRNNRDPIAREHTARFLAYLDPSLSPQRLYYRKDLGAATFLFLETNDFVYGESGDKKAPSSAAGLGTRARAQLSWLREQLAETRERDPSLVIAVLHHPFLQSSKMHRESARLLWNHSFGDQRLLDLLVDGGVDVVLSGHTHTYERFRLVREDGREVDLVNLSGRPRDSVLWFGAGRRRAHDLRNRELVAFMIEEFTGLNRWEIRQEDVMLSDEEADQFALFTVGADGSLDMEVHFLPEEEGDEIRERSSARLYAPPAATSSPATD